MFLSSTKCIRCGEQLKYHMSATCKSHDFERMTDDGTIVTEFTPGPGPHHYVWLKIDNDNKPKPPMIHETVQDHDS